MALNRRTKERYFQIFAYRRQGVHPELIAEITGTSTATVQRALKWVERNSLDFSWQEDLSIAIAEKELELKRLNERFDSIQDGWEETTRKECSNGKVEITTTCKFSRSAEVALLRLIQKTQDDINRLNGLYEHLKLDNGIQEDPQEIAEQISQNLKEMDRRTIGEEDQ